MSTLPGSEIAFVAKRPDPFTPELFAGLVPLKFIWYSLAHAWSTSWFLESFCDIAAPSEKEEGGGWDRPFSNNALRPAYLSAVTLDETTESANIS